MREAINKTKEIINEAKEKEKIKKQKSKYQINTKIKTKTRSNRYENDRHVITQEKRLSGKKK